MSYLQKLDAELEETLAIANQNLDNIPYSTRASWGSVIADAKIKAKALTEEYKKALLQNSVAIFLSGDSIKTIECAKFIKDSGGLVVDAAALYERLAKTVAETFSEREAGGVEWGVTQTHALHLSLQGVMHEVGLKELPMPSQDKRPYVKNAEEVCAHVRNVIRTACGDTLNKLYLEQQLLNAARLVRYDGNVAPVFVINADPTEAANFSGFGKGTVTVPLTAEDIIDKGFLSKTLKDITKTVKQQSENNKQKKEKTRNDY